MVAVSKRMYISEDVNKWLTFGQAHSVLQRMRRFSLKPDSFYTYKGSGVFDVIGSVIVPTHIQTLDEGTVRIQKNYYEAGEQKNKRFKRRVLERKQRAYLESIDRQ